MWPSMSEPTNNNLDISEVEAQASDNQVPVDSQ